MQTVNQIIDLFGGIAKFPALKIEREGFMPLCIERVGVGPRGGTLISVAHYYEQNGDLMRDPDMVFEVIDSARAKGDWWPISFQQDNLGIYQEAVTCDDSRRVLVRPKLSGELACFAQQWDRNLRDQGFLDAAKRKAESR